MYHSNSAGSQTWLVVYDIEDDKIRGKVSDYCLDKGLERIQYSCFLGSMTRTRAKELAAKCQKKIGDSPAKVRFLPVCEKDLAKQIEIAVNTGELGKRTIRLGF